MAKQNCREEINRINKKTNIKVACMKRGTEVLANHFGRNSGNGNVAWMDVVKLR